MAITQSFFEPGAPNFAQQQIQIIPTDDDKIDDDYDNEDGDDNDYEKPKWL